MPRKSQYPPEQQIETARHCLEGQISITAAARELGVDRSTIRAWAYKYREQGPSCFVPSRHNNHYSAELKRQAVREYLDGHGSLAEIAAKHGLRSSSQLKCWIKVHNSGKDLSRHGRGGSRMKKSKSVKTSQSERVTIVQDCIEHDYDYASIAKQYGVSYQQVYSWVKKYHELGQRGLEDRRGKRTAQQEPRTEVEELQNELARLKRELYERTVERDLLKKLNELERGNAFRKHD